MSLELSDFPRPVTVSGHCACQECIRNYYGDYRLWLGLETIAFGQNAPNIPPELNFYNEQGQRELTIFGEQELIALRQKFRVYRFPEYIFGSIFTRLNYRFETEVLKQKRYQ
jgi:hypothetical protein